MSLQIQVNLNTCRQCRHVTHSGGFTVRGARQICGHSDACIARKCKKEFKKEYPEYATTRDLSNWKFHWYNRIVDADKDIPSWCPLRNGSQY